MFWLLNSTGMCVLYATQFCVAFLLLKMEMSVQLVGLFSGLTSVVEAKAGGGGGGMSQSYVNKLGKHL